MGRIYQKQEYNLSWIGKGHVHSHSILFQINPISVCWDSSSSLAPHATPLPLHIAKCQHFDLIGHVKDRYFDLLPCEHCGKHTHDLQRCSRHKTPTREYINLVWINSWKWSLIAKKIYQSYLKVHSPVLTRLAVERPSYSHLVSERGELIINY